MLRTPTAQRIRRWWLTGVVLLLIGVAQMVLGYGFGHFDLNLVPGAVVIAVPFLLKATVERVRWGRQERDRAGLHDHENGP